MEQREKGLDAVPNSPKRHGLPKPAPRMMEQSEPEEERREEVPTMRWEPGGVPHWNHGGEMQEPRGSPHRGALKE